MEGFRVLEGVGDGFGDGGADLDAAFGPVVGDLEIEGLEELALDRRPGVVECLGEVGDAVEAGLEVVGLVAELVWPLGPVGRHRREASEGSVSTKAG